MVSKLPLGWTIHLRDEERKKNFEAAVLNSTVAFDRLRTILEDKLDDLRRMEESDEFYETPNLDQRFVFTKGRMRELHELLRLLTFNGAKTSG